MEGLNIMAKSVFISYSHTDKDVAFKLKEYLEANHVKVIIDTDSLKVGEDIKKYIEKSIIETEITLAIVSKRSLKSGWVAIETANTFFLEKMQNQNRFIACYLDADFFDRKYTDEANYGINSELQEIRDLIKKRMEDPSTPGIRDLQNELSRYQNLKNNLDAIIARLRGSFCVNFCNSENKEAFSIILRAIKDDEKDKNKIKTIEAISENRRIIGDLNDINDVNQDDFNIARSAILTLQLSGPNMNIPAIIEEIKESLGEKAGIIYYKLYFRNEFGSAERLKCLTLFLGSLVNIQHSDYICRITFELVEDIIERQEEWPNIYNAKKLLDSLKIPPYKKLQLYRKLLSKSNEKYKTEDYFWDDVQTKCLEIASESLFNEVLSEVLSTWKNASFDKAMEMLRKYNYRSALPELRDKFNELDPNNIREALIILNLFVEWEDSDAAEFIFHKIEMTTTPEVAEKATIALKTLGQIKYIDNLNKFISFAPKKVAEAIKPIMNKWS
jgi:hypothetical protein